MRVARAISNLIEAFERLPGMGPKSAARLTYYLLHVPQVELDRFAEAIGNLKRGTKECSVCHNISEADPCDVCADESRDKGIICVVEQPLDVLAIERGNGYRGVYHVLHGVIDPLHNIGPEEIKLTEEELQRYEKRRGKRDYFGLESEYGGRVNVYVYCQSPQSSAHSPQNYPFGTWVANGGRYRIC